MKSKAATPAPATKANLPGTFGVPGLTFPFLDNPSQIFGLLMGQDITLVRYDFGPMKASAGFSYNFPPIMVGPVPIAISVGGSVTVKGRFTVGYDTSGLRKVLSGGSGTYLFDGIFVGDLDIDGIDVPEVSFIGEVYAQAAVTVVIASAGIVAGLRITVDLNLNDSPEPDGKLRIEEIFNSSEPDLSVRRVGQARSVHQGVRRAQPVHHVAAVRLHDSRARTAQLLRHVRAAEAGARRERRRGPAAQHRRPRNLGDVAAESPTRSSRFVRSTTMVASR